MTALEKDLGICKIRPFRWTDKDSLARHANNWNIWINLRDGFPHPYTLEDADDWLNLVVDSNPTTQFTIEVEGQAAGGIGFILQSDVHRIQAEIGYWLGEEFWGRGIATAALKTVTEYAFGNFDLLRLYADVFPSNTASARVLEKAGYRLECRQKNCVIKNGQILDQLVYVNFK